jgi:lipoyl-dependent peroxiredoxin subunit D
MAELEMKDQIDQFFIGRESAIARDLKLNLKKLLFESSLTNQEAVLALLALSRSVGSKELADFSAKKLVEFDFSQEQIEEAKECAAIMAMLNTYYRFKHMMNDNESFRTTGLRMTGLAKPALGKERFEMLAFAVSILNGCETCIQSHSQVLNEAGVSVDKRHDLARLASVVKGVSILFV